jgi:tetratricopeptide (TPR) repeat protein
MQQQLIYVLNEMGHAEEAQDRLRHLIEQDPDFAKSYELMFDFKYDARQIAQAIHWLHKAQKLDPGSIVYVLREMWPQMYIGNTAELDRVLDWMETTDPEGSTLVFMEIFINIYKKNYDAALEAAHLFYQRTAYRPGSKYPQILVHSMRNDPTAAREVAESVAPQFFEPENLDKALESNPRGWCNIAWILNKTGDEGMGHALAFKSIDLYKNNPARLSNQAGGFFPALCYMVIDQPEEALRLIEKRTQERQIERWWMALSHPAYQLLRSDPRFIAAEAEIQKIISEEREILANLQAGVEL